MMAEDTAMAPLRPAGRRGYDPATFSFLRCLQEIGVFFEKT